MNASQNKSNFTDRSLSLAPALHGDTKINLSYISQAFKLKEKTSLSLFMFYICLFFWVCIIGFMVYTGLATAFGSDKLFGFIEHIKHLKSHDKFLALAITSGKLIVSSLATAFMVIISCGYLWRVHSGQKKRFFATLPSFKSALKISCVSVISLVLLLLVSSVIFLGLFNGLYHLTFFLKAHHSGGKIFVDVSYTGVCLIIAAFYWVISNYIICVLFAKYKQDKQAKELNKDKPKKSLIKLFAELFKPYFKQFHRFALLMLVWYVILLFPFFVLKPAIVGAGFGMKYMRVTVMIFAGVYLLFMPVIFSTMFNLYLLCFESISNFKNFKKSDKAIKKPASKKKIAKKQASDKQEPNKKAANKKEANKKEKPSEK